MSGGFTLQIVLTGLIALVPSQDQKSMWILLPDARDDYYASDGMLMPKHRPLLVYPCKLRTGYAGKCQDDESDAAAVADLSRTFRPDALKGMGVWQLAGDTVTLAPKTAEGSLDLTKLMAAPGPDMAKVMPGAESIDQDSTNPIPLKGLLAARLDILTGRIDMNDLVPYCNNRDYTFKTLGAGTAVNGNKSHLLKQVTIRMTVLDPNVTLKLFTFGDNMARASITLTPDASNLMTIFLSNQSECPKWQANLCQDPRHTQDAHHFELFYELSDKRPPQHLRPVPYNDTKCTYSAADAEDRPICPMAMFKP